jgi:type IV secretory pathway VirB3-like protein
MFRFTANPGYAEGTTKGEMMFGVGYQEMILIAIIAAIVCVPVAIAAVVAIVVATRNRRDEQKP